MTTKLPAPQAIINAIVALLKSNKVLATKLEFFSIPHYEQRTMNQPICHVFARTRDVEEFASAKRYESTMRLGILIMQPQPEQRSKDRVIHVYEQLVEDTIINNFQLTTQKEAGLLPDNVAVDEISVLGADYQTREDDQLIVDELLMDIQVQYVRVVQ